MSFEEMYSRVDGDIVYSIYVNNRLGISFRIIKMSDCSFAGRDLNIVFFVPDNIDADTHQFVVEMVTANAQESQKGYWTPEYKWGIFPETRMYLMKESTFENETQPDYIDMIFFCAPAGSPASPIKVDFPYQKFEGATFKAVIRHEQFGAPYGKALQMNASLCQYGDEIDGCK